MRLNPKIRLVIKRKNGAIVLKPEIARKLMDADRKKYEELREATKNNRANILI